MGQNREESQGRELDRQDNSSFDNKSLFISYSPIIRCDHRRTSRKLYESTPLSNYNTRAFATYGWCQTNWHSE